MSGLCRTVRAYGRVAAYLVHFGCAVVAQLVADEIALRSYKPGPR